jgi:cysteine desulfuration protein SufE
MFTSCLAKQANLKKIFEVLPTPEARYKKLMEMGRSLPSFPEIHKVEENIVKGCQSILYLHTTFLNGNLYFEVGSEALISAGLASLLLEVYSGESAEVILKCPPSFIDELGIQASLSPGRSNGLASMYLRMKQDALKILMQNSECKMQK